MFLSICDGCGGDRDWRGKSYPIGDGKDAKLCSVCTNAVQDVFLEALDDLRSRVTPASMPTQEALFTEWAELRPVKPRDPLVAALEEAFERPETKKPWWRRW